MASTKRKTSESTDKKVSEEQVDEQRSKKGKFIYF